jgi:hypothetical protein
MFNYSYEIFHDRTRKRFCREVVDNEGLMHASYYLLVVAKVKKAERRPYGRA